MQSSVLAPDWLLTPEGWKSGWQLVIQDGRILSLGPVTAEATPLPRQALLPGLVNAHSHAFQRLIRGRTEWRHRDRPQDDFWSWRELMYQAALSVTPEQLEQVARLLYLEMVESGITCVGEFHYLHHQADGQPYAQPDELALRLVEAARWAGLHIVVLRCAYQRSGFEQPVNPLQRRFFDRHWSEATEAVERLLARGVAAGLAPHSVRAVTPEWLPPLAEFARQQGLPLHMHVSEQPAEVAQCLAETGLRPIQFLHRLGLLEAHFTGVHAIHLEPAEVTMLRESLVCSCPTTERNLGDGIVPALAMRQAGVRFALGSDSQCQVDLWEDARQLEYHLRLQERQRALLDLPEHEERLEHWLLAAASRGGAQSLGQPCGQLQAGLRADLVAFDLDHPRLASADPQWMLSELLWSASRDCVSQVWVGGEARLQEGKHPLREQAVGDYLKVVENLKGG